MPRLLLVDDNPSIHRIAESLLTPTDVELTCADSAEEALDRIARGERFDVALVDTAMPGMDGWTLLTRLRAMEATAQIPIALMAGVLDPVDPAKLAKAPVQGFLKKPIELRELGDRVRTLLATPVVNSPSPFSTLPATASKDLVRRAEAALPEYRPEPEPEQMPEPVGQAPVAEGSAVAPAPSTPGGPESPLAQDDLLLLDAEDLWPEEPIAARAPEVATAPEVASGQASDVQLELEELDLESLQDLAAEPPLPSAPAPVPDLAAQEPVPVEPAEVEPAESDLAATALAALGEDEEALVTLSGLEELDVLGSVPDLAVAGVQAPPPAASAADRQSPAAEGQLGLTPPPPAASAPLPSGSTDAQQTQVLLHALLAEPVLMDALVKALVARMGDEVLREVAWEVMPDLAGRLQR